MDGKGLVFIDANIFLEFFLGDAHADVAEIFLKRVRDKEVSAVTSDFIIYTCLLQIQRKVKKVHVMREFILFVNQLDGLTLLRPSLEEIYDAIKMSDTYQLDFDDSLVVSCMRANNIKTLISLDTDFDKVSVIKRISPEKHDWQSPLTS